MAGAGYVLICLCFGLAGGIIGRIKGSSFVLWFLISGLIPFFGLLAAIFYRWDNRELRRRCPQCGRVVKLHDAKCMRCGEELEFPEVAIASEAAMRGVTRPS
jgi:DNA-directed RNA polymerase subunit RPC12/RpoP